VGIKEVHDDIWLVSFMDYDLGYFDLDTRVLEPIENPFGPKVLVVSRGRRNTSVNLDPGGVLHGTSPENHRSTAQGALATVQGGRDGSWDWARA
jgi:putative transposase